MNTIQMANTQNGFAIAITQTPYRADPSKPLFSVVRVNQHNKFVTISDHSSESEARKAANKEWLADMGRGPAMIY